MGVKATRQDVMIENLYREHMVLNKNMRNREDELNAKKKTNIKYRAVLKAI